MSAPTIVLLLLGVFYTVAGLFAGRAALTDAWLDAALSAIGGDARDRVAVERTWWLVGSAAVISAGGLLLLVGSAWAVVPFGLSVAGQALYLLVLAPRRFDLNDPPSPEGRRQTVNAFLIYVAMTVIVGRAAAVGPLRAADAAMLLPLAGATLLWLTGVGYATVQLWKVSHVRPTTPEVEPMRAYEDDYAPDTDVEPSELPEPAELDDEGTR